MSLCAYWMNLHFALYSQDLGMTKLSLFKPLKYMYLPPKWHTVSKDVKVAYTIEEENCYLVEKAMEVIKKPNRGGTKLQRNGPHFLLLKVIF